MGYFCTTLSFPGKSSLCLLFTVKSVLKRLLKGQKKCGLILIKANIFALEEWYSCRGLAVVANSGVSILGLKTGGLLAQVNHSEKCAFGCLKGRFLNTGGLYTQVVLMAGSTVCSSLIHEICLNWHISLLSTIPGMIMTNHLITQCNLLLFWIFTMLSGYPLIDSQFQIGLISEICIILVLFLNYSIQFNSIQFLFRQSCTIEYNIIYIYTFTIDYIII